MMGASKWLSIRALRMSRKAIEMRFFHEHQNGKLKCPYKGCEKEFDKPTVITDTSIIPRQTHYACPYCMSKLEIATQRHKNNWRKRNRISHSLRFTSQMRPLQRTPTRAKRKHACARRMLNLPKSASMQRTQ